MRSENRIGVHESQNQKAGEGARPTRAHGNHGNPAWHGAIAVYWIECRKQITSNLAFPKIGIAILAAGKGTRLKSKHPKVLHEVGGKPLLAHVIAAATKVVPAADVFAIIGYEADRVRSAVAASGIGFVVQEEQHGTGHALMVARQALAAYDLVIVLYGDAPLITSQTIERLRDFHLSKKAAMTILTARLENAAGYGESSARKPAATT